jgi:hypothetical protein
VTNPCDTFATACDSADAGDGTCARLGSSLLCVQAGTASPDSCDRSATRQSHGQLCPVGSGCFSAASGDVCRQLCDPAVGEATGCAAGSGCESFVGAGSRLADEGFCVPVSDAGCASGGTGVNFEFACQTSADCECPFLCVGADGGTAGTCLTPCESSTDCASQQEWCVAGLCRPVLCGTFPDGGTNGIPGGSCTGSASETGTCFGPFGSGFCYRGGTATSTCVNAATNWDPAEQCVVGSLCYPAPPETGVCVSLCDTTAGAGACPAGFGCDQIFVDFFPSNLGECVLLGDGGCNASGRGDTQSICDTSAHCACPYTCHDAGDGTSAFCAVPCQTSADCPDPSTSCQAGVCLQNGCSGLGSLCDAGGAEDGTCQAEPFPALGLLCVQAGDAGQSCDPFAMRDAPSSLCPLHQACVQIAAGGLCETLCDPSTASGCTSPAICFPSLLGLAEGACTACVNVQGFCTDTSQCCAGVCDPNSFVCL